nr:unnamed protein product [Naegleria fowleri]
MSRLLRRFFSSYHTRLFGCGFNGHYQLFLNDNINRNVFTASDAILFSDREERIKMIDAGEKHAFVLTNKGRLFGIGCNDVGQVGVGNVTSFLVNIPEGSTSKQMMEKVTSSTHIDIDHILNPPGTTERDYITVVACGRDFSFIATKQGKLYSCGSNLYGNLGLDLRTKNKTYFTRVNFPKHAKIANISCGAYHTIILTEDHHIYGMGLNIFGQLGFNPKEMEKRIQQENYFQSKGEQLDFSYVSKPIRVDCFDHLAYEGDYIAEVATGACHTVFLTKSGKVYVCGLNIHGEIGLGKDVRCSYTPVNPIFLHPMPYMDDIPVVKWISAGLDHTILVTESGEAYACGKNEDGQLGLGDYKNRYEFNMIEKFEQKNIRVLQATCGMSHTYFTTTSLDGSSKQDFYATGCNTFGNLGLGHFYTVNEPKLLSGVAKAKEGIRWQVFCSSHSNTTYLVQIKEKSLLKRIRDSLFMGA